MERESTQSRWAINPRRALALLRITLGLLLLGAFLENYQKGLYTAETYAGYIESLITRGATPDFWKGALQTLAEHAATVAPLQAVLELSLGGLLFLGLLTRLAAGTTFLLLSARWLSEWGIASVGEMAFPMIVALLLAFSNAGHWAGLDGVLSRRRPTLTFG
ncbi:MAG TPA: DoxX family membrane protein [Armatimonadota bacterium]|jgi:uncharacterized membrane protein YphA (DoxX/SURF4 family)|nr:DoxX family membrane protein [Armatimonadota bacterium]HOJ21030.1 DoxX family membrane protein [Armatimonadota bacterium]HOM81986.1 DoxX family membrane protein [Armatimonadota bacterium]HOQ28132.1 DoxX family membrane protein [Armatimonadota bacterium]HPO72248.1 DoxX family membrane protein [Armatimonadota bacterium]